MRTESSEAARGVHVAPLRGARAMIADKMRASLAESAQVTHHADCEAEALLAWKERLAGAGERVSLEDLIIDRTVSTLRDHPDLNGFLKDREIHLHDAVHLGVAIALPGNLLVAPAIFDADLKSLAERANARKDLVARAQTNKLTVAEMTGATFTVTNLGRTRVRYFTPIVNPPQIAILGVGAVLDPARAGPGGAVEMRPTLGLSLTFDHRAVDGAPAAAFLSALCEAIEAA
jgi:pyruvate/2-oxoglutarate dehydrogenase complex dihydrolipoamide acyltransferase (E2) component